MFRSLLAIALLVVPVAGSEVFRSPSVAEAIWNEVAPFLMPADHPAKTALDKIFSDPHVICDRNAMQKAGFKISKPRKWDNIFIATHKKLKGYVIKLYLDEQGALPDWYNWVKRARGASVIRQAIKKNGFESMFSVPQKWIYPLPRVAEKPEQKSFILIVEDMDILSDSENKKAWKNSKKISKKKLEALFILLKQEKLIDSVYIDNIPFSRNGKIAFIDTEHYQSNEKGVRFDRLTSRLPSKLRAYWIQLIQ